MKNRWLEPLRRQFTAPGSARKRREKGHRSRLVAAEVCESRVLLSGSSMTDGGSGHQAALALVDTSQATHTAVASGDWTDPAVWQNEAVPTSGARVVIPTGSTVTVNRTIAEEFKTIRVDGTLRFRTDVHTELRVDTLVTTMSGRLEMGTASQPVQSDVTSRIVFADDGAIDISWDPRQLSRGALLMGQTEIHGAAKTHRTTLSSFPRAGEQTLQFHSAPTGWQVGDSLTITGTQGATSDEVRSIASIDGATVRLDRPLDVDHVPPRADVNVYVANTTRNVQLESENTQLDRRGHVMFMHTLDAQVAHAAFLELGRTDKSRPLDDINFDFTEDAVGNTTSAGVVFTTTTGARTNIRGRYSVHFHRGGTSPTSTPAVVSGSVVVGSPGYGFVNHTSHVNFIDNVAYNVAGSAYYTEAGDEIGSMTGNIAIRTVSPTFQLGDEGAIDPDLRANVQDFGVDGDGFWLSGHLVSMKNNVSAGATGHGIIIWSDGLVEADRGRATVRVADVANGHLITGRDTIPTWWAPLAEISNNESYGATIGFRSRYVHSSSYLGEQGSAFHTAPDQAYIDTLNPVVDGLTVWGSRDGVLLNYNERLSLKNARIIGTGAPYVQNGGTADTGVGIDMYNEVSRGPGVLENIRVEGFNMGILMPRHDAWTVNNLSLSNTTDLLITEARAAARQLDMTNVTFGSLAGTAVAGNESQRQNVLMQADLEADGFQPYWFLLENRTTLNGQGLYFDQQAASHVPLETLDNGSLIAPVSAEFVGQTNQQWQDRYGTSFGGAITPPDATTVSWVSGGVVGSAAAPPATYPPLYSMIGEASLAILIDPGTLTNFDGPGQGDGTGGDDGADDDGSGDDGTGDDGSDDDGSDDEGSDDEGSDDVGSDDDGSDDDGSDDDGSDDVGSDDVGSDDDGSDDDGSDDDGSDDEGSDDEGSDDEGSDDEGSDDDGSDDEGMDDDGSGDDGSDDEGSDDEGSDDEGSDDEGSDDEGSDDEGSDDEGSDDEGSDDEGSDDEGSDDEGSDDEGSGDEGSDDEGSDDDGMDDEGSDARRFLAQLDSELELRTTTNDFQNWLGRNERWLWGAAGWYFITPDGTLHEWQEGTESRVIAQLAPTVHTDLTLLTMAAERVVPPQQETRDRQLAETAIVLDTELGLRSTGNTFDNWLGRQERWLWGQSGWYFLLPDGTLYRWQADGTAQQVDQLDVRFHRDVSLLTSASEMTVDQLFTEIATGQTVV